MVDLLVLGATGFTGRLITKYLAVHHERDSFTLGLAGRSKAKVYQLVDDLELCDVETFIVDVRDDASIDALLDNAQPKIVLTTVGPYEKYGMPVARACARSGVHYVDITGETIYVGKLIAELDETAKKTKSILIPSSGFYSAPSDALAYLSARTLQFTLKESVDLDFNSIGVAESHTMVKVGEMSFSGGSIETFLYMLETASRRERVRIQAPDVISPVKLRAPQHLKLVHSLPESYPKRFGNLHLLVASNVSIVQRTRGLFQQNTKNFGCDDVKDGDLEPVYADDFAYYESQEASSKPSAFFNSLAVTSFSALLALSPQLRWLFRRVSPASGEGPPNEIIENGWVEMTNISLSSPLPSTKKPIIVESHLRASGDPGYALSSMVASEIALALLTPRESLPRLAREGGVLTPAAALGPIIIERLSATGKVRFESEVRIDRAK